MSTTDVHDALLTPSEAAVRLRVSTATIRRLCANGELEHLRVGHQIRIREEVLMGEIKQPTPIVSPPRPQPPITPPKLPK